jgi:hypothetical protein
MSTDALVGFPEALRACATSSASALAALDALLAASPRSVVVVIGSSISGLLVAAGLARGGCEVVLITGPAPLPRRLINGCTFRAGALASAADLLGIGVETLLERIAGPGPVFQRMAFANSAVPDPLPNLRLRYGSASDPASTSTRHGQILQALRASLPTYARLHLVAAQVPAAATLDGERLPLAFMDGSTATLAVPLARAVLLNATPNPLLLRPNTPRPEESMRVAVVQIALRQTQGAPRWGARTALGCLVEGRLFPHQLFFAPFSDPDTPAADAYVFNGKALSEQEIARCGGGAVVLEDIRTAALAWSKACGFEPVALDASSSAAIIPYNNDTGVALHKTLDPAIPLIDINKAFSSGAPGVALDGMLCQSRAAHAFVDAFVRALPATTALAAARNSLVAADAAIAPVRRLNRVNVWLPYRAPRVLRRALLATMTDLNTPSISRMVATSGMPHAHALSHTDVLRQIGPGIYTLRRMQALFRLFGALSSRMTIVVAGDGGVILHSPVPLTARDVAAIRLLGPVRHIIAPNLEHTKALAACRATFPEARVHVPPGFASRHPGQAAQAGILDPAHPVATDDLSQIFMEGHSVNETIFLHRASRTLIVTDLAYNIDPGTSAFERWWFRVFGGYDAPRLPVYHKLLVRDRTAFSAAWQRVLALDFDTVSVAHGSLLTRAPKDAIRAQWASLGILL